MEIQKTPRIGERSRSDLLGDDLHAGNAAVERLATSMIVAASLLGQNRAVRGPSFFYFFCRFNFSSAGRAQYCLDLSFLFPCNLFTMEPPSKKPRKLLDEDSSSDSGDESGGVPIGEGTDYNFKINEEYARRFEHNKKREEKQQCMYSPRFDYFQHLIFRYSGSKIRQIFQFRKAS